MWLLDKDFNFPNITRTFKWGQLNDSLYDMEIFVSDYFLILAWLSMKNFELGSLTVFSF